MATATVLLATGCARVANPQGWAAPVQSDGALFASLDDGKLSALQAGSDTLTQSWVFPAQEEFGCGNEASTKRNPQGIYGAPALGNDHLYFGAYDGAVYALTVPGFAPAGQTASPTPTPAENASPTASVSPSLNTSSSASVSPAPSSVSSAAPQAAPTCDWRFETGDRVIASPVLVGNNLYVGSTDGILYLLDTTTGRELARFDAGEGIWAAPLVTYSAVYVAAVNGKLYALKPDTLTPLWDTPFEASAGLLTDPVMAGGAPHPPVPGQTLLVGGIDEAMHGVDAATGKEKWSFKAGNWFWSRPVVDGDTVIAPNMDGKVYALDLATGAKKWEFDANGPVRSAGVLAGNTLVVANKNGEVFGLDPAKGTLAWAGPTLLNEGVVADLVPFDFAVLALTQDHTLFKIDPNTGKPTTLRVAK